MQITSTAPVIAVLGSVTWALSLRNGGSGSRPPSHSIIQLFFFLDAPVLWMLTDSGSVPLPALTKHLSEGGRKAFQPSTPLSPWECGSRDGTWHGGGMGKWGFL